MKVAVVDDTPSDAQRLVDYLERFRQEQRADIQTDVYHASVEFLEVYQPDYDVVFLDIEMPGSDGLQVAHEIRAKDTAVGIIFITNMAQYAIRGYEVNAIDFMVKPVGYYNFAEKLEKAIRFSQKRNRRYLLLRDEDGMNRVSTSEILYVEKDRDYLVYHTGLKNFRERGTMKDLKDKLSGLTFSECTSGILVNLSHVRRIGKETVCLGGETLPLSRRMKKSFTQDFIDYIGGAF